MPDPTSLVSDVVLADRYLALADAMSLNEDEIPVLAQTVGHPLIGGGRAALSCTRRR